MLAKSSSLRESRRLEQMNLASIDQIVDSGKSEPEVEIAALTEGREGPM